jgi:hypothetical protein
MKYLEIHFKNMCDLYVENYTVPMREIKDLNKWRDIPCLWAEILNITQMSILPMIIHGLHAISIRI